MFWKLIYLLWFLVYFDFYLYVFCLRLRLDGDIRCRLLFASSCSDLPPGQHVNNPGVLHRVMVSKVNQDIV